ncbi:hypothetical protein A4D02_27440 [Niastella koreensis]|nr:hypothetical protein A4D02_27440 [Niastella koreensis]
MNKRISYQPGEMIASLAVTVFLLCLSQKTFSQENTWQQKQSLGVPATTRMNAVSFSIKGKGYVGTGRGGKAQSDFWEYDPVTNVWTQKANFAGGARFSATGFSIDNKGYIGLGDSLKPIIGFEARYSDFWEYDPGTNIWTRKADFPGGARSGAAGFSIGSKGYIGTGIANPSGGISTGFSTNDFWEYDPATNSWAQKASFSGRARSFATGLCIGNKGYIGLGNAFIDEIGASFNDFWEYEPVTDTWAQKADFGGGARAAAVGFSIGNTGFVGTGQSNMFSFSTNDVWAYDPVTNAWTKKASVGGTGNLREQAVGFSIGNKGYIGTGYRGTPSSLSGPKNDFWEYDTTMDAWTQKADLGGGPRANATGFSVNDKGYVGTGYDGAAKKDFWEYDPATGNWTRKADFPGGIRRKTTGFNTYNFLGKGCLGQGYVTGRSDLVNDFWQYDPMSNSWARMSSFTMGRGSAISFNANYRYVGFGDFPAFFSDLWQYNPGQDSWTQQAGLPAAAGATRGFGAGDKVYVFGNGFWEYNAGTNTWTQKQTPHIGGINYAFNIKDKGYVLTDSNVLWLYNAVSDTWAPRAAFPGRARQNGTAFSIGDNGYFGFGDINNEFLNDFWEYTPAADNAITISAASTTVCSGSKLAVTYTTTGIFEPGNVFTVLLGYHNIDNSFINKVIGSDTATTGRVINVTLPDSLRFGNQYDIKMVSSNPAVTSNNIVNLEINPLPVAKAKNTTAYLNESGIAEVMPREVNNGSFVNCGPVQFALDHSSFTCENTGPNKVTLTVTDRNGNSAADSAVVTVVDTLSPVISDAFAIPPFLWPPDHMMKKVRVFYKVTDNCGVADNSLSVTSNGQLTGNRPDWTVLDDHHLLLRSELNERGKERIYFISIKTKDNSGNTGTKVVKVVVPGEGKHFYWPEVGNHNGKDENESCETDKSANGLHVHALPNPSSQYFTITIRSNDKQPVTLRIINSTGRVIETHTAGANGSLQIGGNYMPGTYFIQVVQGRNMVTLHLVKQPG